MSRKVIIVGSVGLVTLVVAGAVLALGQGHLSPQLSRQQAIDVALHADPVREPPRRIAAKLVHRTDLESLTTTDLHAGNELVWVVAVSGDFGPECSQCPTPNTWGIAVIPDHLPGQVTLFIGGRTGDWPPFFDRLQDLGSQS
jgi:hypothetical protein